MTAEQFEQTVRAFLRREPFQPFTIVLAGGDRVEVDQPEFVALAGGAGGYINPAGEPIFFDCDGVLEILLTTSEVVF
jgi:hypothetical protein